MKLTYSDIVSLFRSDYSEAKSSFIDDTDIMIYWWKALSQFYNEVDCEWTRSEATIPTINGKSEYPIPDDCRKIIAVFNLQDNQRWVRLIPAQYKDFLEKPIYNTTSDEFTHYYVLRNQLGIHPTPNETSYETLYSGTFTQYSNTSDVYLFYDPSASWTTDELIGQKIDITYGSVTYTFTISANTSNIIQVDSEPAFQTSIPGYDPDIHVYTANFTYEIYQYVQNIKMIYAQRPPIPNEDDTRSMSSITLSSQSATFEYDIPEEYLDVLMSYMLFLACRKDKLYNDANYHLGNWQVGILKAKKYAGIVIDDYYKQTRFKSAFDLPPDLKNFYG